MADTIGGRDFGKCEDNCGEEHATLVHWGPLVPDGRRVVLCGSCMKKRSRWFNKHGSPLQVPASVEEVMDA
jgi:hypothetical protein